jgi:hypothetical protein
MVRLDRGSTHVNLSVFEDFSLSVFARSRFGQPFAIGRPIDDVRIIAPVFLERDRRESFQRTNGCELGETECRAPESEQRRMGLSGREVEGERCDDGNYFRVSEVLPYNCGVR